MIPSRRSCLSRLCCLLCLVVFGCGAPRAALQPVSLPEISTVTQPAAREQLRDAYATLDARLKDPGAAPAELANRFGEMGRLLMAAEFVVAAEPFFQNAEALSPGDRRWPYYLGHVYRVRGDVNASASAFERALTLAPSDEATLVWLGDAYLNQGRLDAAQTALNKALAANPRSVAALYRLGRAALAEGDAARAADDFERGLAIDARATILRYPLSLAYRQLGDATKADAQLRQRGDFDVGPVDPLMQQVGGLLDTAAVFERQAIEASKTNDWKSAALYLRKAVSLEPADASLRQKLGTALSMAGDNTAAIVELQQALRMAAASPGSPWINDARFNLGQLLLGAGRADEAVIELQRVVHDVPGDQDARAALARAQAARRPR